MARDHDVTGQDSLVSNVLFSWGGHCLFIIAGFVLPRMIDDHLGRPTLGVWDFSWSLVSYFTLVQAGIASSVNRYVARYRATQDQAGINRIVSTASCILLSGGVLVLILSGILAWFLPTLFGSRLGANTAEAQWVVFLSGASLAVQMVGSPYGGVITGCHRWDYQNGITYGWQVTTVGAMITALVLKRHLTTLSGIYFAGAVAAEMTRLVLAYRVCQGLQVRLSLVRRATIRNVFVFGGKTLIPSVSKLLLNQTINVLILAYLTPASLALYARPRALMRHVETLVNKMGMILVPTASSLQGADDLAAIRSLLIKSVRYSLYLALPMVLVLAIFGDAIMQLWMGPDYADWRVPAILSLGFLAMLVQTPVLMILAGLNAHGRAGISQLVASLCTVGLALLALGVARRGIAGVAVAATVPMTILYLTYLPRLVCRRVDLSVRHYFVSVAKGPAVHVSPLAASLIAARLIFAANPLQGLAWGGTLGMLALGVVYWRWVLPARMKSGLSRRMGRIARVLGRSASAKNAV